MKYIGIIKTLTTIIAAAGMVAMGAIRFNQHEVQHKSDREAIDNLTHVVERIDEKLVEMAAWQIDNSKELELVKRNTQNLNNSFVRYISNDNSLTKQDFLDYIQTLPAVRLDSFKIGVRLR